MKFVLRELLLQIIILIHFVSGISCTQVIEYSEKNALTTTEHSNRSFPLTISIENATIPESTKRNKSSPKRRRRIRRKRKRPIANQSTTVIPNFDFPTIVSTVNYSNDTLIIRTSHRRRKLKKRRKGGTRKRKGKIIATTAQTIIYNKLESKNLVLPIIPTQKSDSILRSSSTVAKSTQRMKQTRCMKNNGGCAHICNSRKIEKCQCFKGFTLANDRHSCTDINECLVNNGDCQMNCTNTIGSYRCQCPHGLRLNMDSKSCEDVNECLLRNGHGPCQDTCENTYGGYKCSCVRLTGTKLGNDLHSCVDVDECAKENGGCSHICINTFGRSFCSCPDGMELSGLKTCQDINECENENIKSHCTNGCINMEGSYRCASIVDLQNDESYSNVVCKPLFPPQNGYFKCSRKHALKTFTKSGRKRIKNSLGTKCILVCPEGFKRRGQGFRISCGYGGQWMGNMDAKCVGADLMNRAEEKGSFQR